MFPPGKTLIVPPSQVWSRSGTAALGAPRTNYPAANLVDGSSASAGRSTSTSDAASITLPGAQTPNIFGIISHNITYAQVCGFRTLSGDALHRGAGARRPNFWLDLRGFPATSAAWQFYVNANARPISIGEIVIATGFEFDGDIVNEPEETITFPQERAALEYGRLAISSSGSLLRRMRLHLSLTAADKTNLLQISTEAGGTAGPPERVIVVPSTHRNDIWFVEWPEIYEEDFTVGEWDRIEVTLDLREEAAGAI